MLEGPQYKKAVFTNPWYENTQKWENGFWKVSVSYALLQEC